MAHAIGGYAAHVQLRPSVGDSSMQYHGRAGWHDGHCRLLLRVLGCYAGVLLTGQQQPKGFLDTV